jgi:hypothetical protein
VDIQSESGRGLFGMRVLDEEGHYLGRVAGVVHHSSGLHSALVSRRFWLFHRGTAVPLEKARIEGGRVYVNARPRRVSIAASHS